MSAKSQVTINTTGFNGLLFLLFLGLKLTDYIDWSWWWVTAPLWIPPMIVIGVVGFVFCLGMIAAALK